MKTAVMSPYLSVSVCICVKWCLESAPGSKEFRTWVDEEETRLVKELKPEA